MSICKCWSWAGKFEDKGLGHHPRCTNKPKPDPEVLNQAREFFASSADHEFYSAVAYSGYKHATERQAELLAEFAIKYHKKELEKLDKAE